MAKACLVDVYDTILRSDYPLRLRAMTVLAGVDAEVWVPEWNRTAVERDRGKLSMAESFALTLRACGKDPRPELVAELVSEDRRLLREGSELYDDTAVFLAKLRSRGTGIALVSNCQDNTRQMLEYHGVLPLADAAVLSYEIGSIKPSPEIYLTALDDLGVAAADAVMIDDQVKFCIGAEAVGIRAIQIVRANHHGEIAEAGFPVASSLLDTLPLLLRLLRLLCLLRRGLRAPVSAPAAARVSPATLPPGDLFPFLIRQPPAGHQPPPRSAANPQDPEHTGCCN